MGGKPQKPKIQAYVDQQWFDEFENYRQQHNLNQSKTLEKILSQFFGSKKQPSSLEPPTYTVALEEVYKKLDSLGQRILVVEDRLAIASVDESAVPLAESVVRLSRLANESANETAVALNGLAAESSIESAFPLPEQTTLQTESALPLAESAMELNGLANESASESANESATFFDGLANESALPPSKSAVAPNRLAVESALPLVESATEVNESANESASESASESAVAPHGLASESAQESASVDEAIAPDSTPDEVNRGKRPPEKTRKLIESRLAHGEIIDIKKLAEIASVTAEAVRQRTEKGKLGAWGVEPIPNTRPQRFRRI